MRFEKNSIEAVKVIRIALASLLAILAADVLGLKYSATAGIIALLSIQDTKRETVWGAVRRCISYIAAVGVSWVVFHFFGFHAYSYGVFLLIFVAASYYIGWQDVLSTSAVVTTHFLTEAHYGLDVVGNELALLAVGTGMALLMNLLLGRGIQAVLGDIEEVEKRLKVILNDLSAYVQRVDDTDLDGEALGYLEQFLEESRKRAYQIQNNTMFADSEYYLDYMEMRKAQCQTLRQIHDHLHHLAYVPEHAALVAKFIRHVADTVQERNNADGLIMQLHELIRLHKGVPLPENQIQMEDFAILYDVLNELEYFLKLKKKFVEGLSQQQVKRYWEEG